MYFELQLSADVFTRIARNRLKAIPLCVDREFDLEEPPGSGNKVRVVVDRVEIGDTTFIQREQTITYQPSGLPQTQATASQNVWIFTPTNLTSFYVPYLQIKQEVKIHLVKYSDLEANGVNPSAPFKTLTLYPVFNVSLNPAKPGQQGGGPLVLSYDLAQIDFGLLAIGMSESQRKEIEQFIANVKLPPTIVDMGPLTTLLKRPVNAINAGISCDVDHTFVSLRADFDVYASPAAISAQFFQTGPTKFLEDKAWAMLIDANLMKQDAVAKTKSALQSSSDVKLVSGPTATWNPASVKLSISAEVELIDACPFFVDDIDMDADVTIDASFSVPTTNTLRTHFHIEGDPSNGVEIFFCALTGALLWPFIGPLFLKKEDIGEGLGAYFGGLAGGPVVTFIALIAAIESAGLTKDISSSMGSTCKKVDDENYQCNDVLNMQMSLVPKANSRLDLEKVAGIPEGLVVSGTISNLRDYAIGSIESVHLQPFTWQIVGSCRGNGKNNFSIGNRAKISVMGVPPAQMCHAYLLDDPQGEFALQFAENSITIIPRFKPAYTAAPYPCRIRVITPLGVRTLTIPPPAALTNEQAQELDTARLRAIASCYYWEKVFTPVEKIQWLPDPPFDNRMTIQFWQIVVRGMQREETLRVEGLQDRTLMTARPSQAGVAHLTLMFSGEDAPPELSIELMNAQVKEVEEEREISVQQILFEWRASMPAFGELRALRFEGTDRNRQLVIIDSEREMTWNVTASMAPVLLSSLSLGETERQETNILSSGKRVGDPASQGFSQALEQLQKQFGDAEAVGCPRIGGIKESIYIRTKQKTALYDLSSEKEPREMQTYEDPAWLEGVALGGHLLAKHNPTANTVELYAATVIETI